MKFSILYNIRKFLIKVGLQHHPLPSNRKILIGNFDPISANSNYLPDHKYRYPNNNVKSSRYTVVNFLPKNLFEQFQRIANFYFLCIALVQLFIETTVPIFLNIFPLIFVICATMVKQGYEDILRHMADAEVNNLLVQVFRTGKLIKIKSKDIVIGDIVYCETNETFPCDLVLLSSSEPTGICYVTTASLDGETNLKVFTASQKTKSFNDCDKINQGLHFIIQCEHPTEDLYRFEGQISPISNLNDVSPLVSNNLLLRGARLRNTNYVFGCAIYTGQDTKMALNSCSKIAKFSQVELRLNLFLAVFLLILLIAGILCTSMKFMMVKSVFVNSFYIPTDSTAAWKVVETFFTFIVLFNYLIPISLYVTIELQKFFGSMFFGWDLNMYDSINDLCARSNTSDLNEELGQIEFLFSDKTGTLTENEMRFRQVSINGVKYVDNDGILQQLSDNVPVDWMNLPEDVEQFFTVLSLCHTVRVELTSDNKREYQASSPDEKAFLEASRQYGIIYEGQNNEEELEITFTYPKTIRKRYKVLAVLEFDSDRKRMSIVVENEDGTIDLHCKGAETAMISQARTHLHASSNNNIDIVMQHVTDYAIDGLRTLVIGTRRLSLNQYEDLHKNFIAAQSLLNNRDQELRKTYDAFESDLVLLGCTGVEDKLQDEVKETLEDLRAAGIQVWILTGDKEETAVNISHSTGHFHSKLQEIRITKQNELMSCLNLLESQLERMLINKNNDPNIQFGLIIDGQSLSIALRPVLVDKLRALCLECIAVLCCRMTPLQKSEVVSLIKMSKVPVPVTAAVGDGANDVSMILEAHIGIGLFGKEGRQAVRAADYAIPRFKFLRNALLVHGHYYYVRIATLVQYFFYKNTAFIGPQFYFTFFSGFSAQTVYESLYLVLYNITLTSLPIFIYGLLEKHVPPKVLLEQPKLYQRIRQNNNLSWSSFVKWNLFGLWHSLVAMFGPVLIIYQNDIVTNHGRNLQFYYFGTIILAIVWITTSLKLCLVTYYWNMATLLGFSVTVIGNLSLLLMYQGFIWNSDTYDVYWTWFELFQQPFAWLYIFIFVLISIIPDVIHRLIQDQDVFRKNSVEFYQEGSAESKNSEKSDAIADIHYECERENNKNLHFYNGGFIAESCQNEQNASHDAAFACSYVKPVHC